MKKWKYVIIDADTLVPILFPERVNHADMIPVGMHSKVVSAGFCSIWAGDDKIEVRCYGESVSLKKKSAPGDEDVIAGDFNSKRLF